jgi:uncharacterized membrane protein
LVAAAAEGELTGVEGQVDQQRGAVEEQRAEQRRGDQESDQPVWSGAGGGDEAAAAVPPRGLALTGPGLSRRFGNAQGFPWLTGRDPGTATSVPEMSSPPDPAHPADLPQPGKGRDPGVTALIRMGVAALVGVLVGVGVGVFQGWSIGVLLGWMAAGAVFVTWMWLTIWPMDPASTARHAVREDPGRAAADVVVLVAAVASLGAVALFLLAAGSGSDQTQAVIQAALSVASVALAWGTVHTIFTTRYARLYYTGPDGGIDYNEDDAPRYSDFAYLAFTIGMTFQVSDTDLKTKHIRATALRHALLSYLFGAVVLATTINLVAGLAK